MGPATKQDLQEATQGLRQELREATQGVRQELREVKQELIDRIAQSSQEVRTEMLPRMDEHSASLEESIRDSQTELLKAFLPFQEAQRVHPHNRGVGSH